MKRIENHLGEISLTDGYLKSLIACSVIECIGVVGLNGIGVKQKLKALAKLPDKGTGIVLKATPEGELDVELHITASFGTNISTVVHSVEDKVKYALSSEAGVEVRRVDTYVDEMKA